VQNPPLSAGFAVLCWPDGSLIKENAMTLSEVERAKLVVRIDHVTRDKKKLEQGIKEAEANFAAAWECYGSELAGDDGSRELKRELASATQLLDLLERCQKGFLDVSEENARAVFAGVQQLRIRKQVVQEQIEKLECALSDIEKVRKALLFQL
jgi:hypothetical protein